MILKKKIIAIIPYRGIGDLIFHVPFLKGIYSKYKSELIIFTNSANKAKNILKNERYIKKIEYLNFQRENQLRNSLLLLKNINSYCPDICILTAPTKRLIIPLFMSNSKKNFYFKKDKIKDLSKYIEKQSNICFPGINFQNNYNLNYNTKSNKRNLFISIDSHHDTNNWGEKNYLKLIKNLIKIPKIKKIYVNYAPSKIKNFKHLYGSLRTSKKISFTYKKKFNDIIKIINSCYYVIGNESGPICIGAALNKNVQSIYYPKHTNRSSGTNNRKVKFYNSNSVSNKKIIEKICKNL